MKHDPVAELVIHDEGDRMGANWTMLKAGYELPAGRYALYTHPAPVQAQSEPPTFAEWTSDYVRENLHKLKPAPVQAQSDPDTCQMCGDKPYPGCNSEFQGEKTCRFWAALVQQDVRLKNIQDMHTALAEAHSNALKEIDQLNAAPVQQEPKCSTHPKAPHGFDRNGSHNAGRYVCECEGWDAYSAGFQAGIEHASRSDE